MATVRNTISLQDRMSPVLRSVIKALSSTVQTMATVDRVSNTSFNKMKNDVLAAEAAVNQMEMELKGVGKAAEEASNKMGGFKNPLVTLSAGVYLLQKVYQGLKKITDVADDLAGTTARLNLMNDGLQTTLELQDMLLQVSNKSRTSYMETAATVAKLGVLAGSAFSSNEEMLLFAEQMNKQFKIGGASLTEQSAAMYQLTQAMASGTLQGDEFRSIRENAPLLAKAIAKYTGKSIGELKEMGAQGLITAEVIKNAMFAAMDETNAKFAQLPITFEQSTTIIKNKIITSLQPVFAWMSQAAAWIVTNWEKIVPVVLAVASALLIYAAVTGIAAVATWIANGAAAAFFATLLTNPITWIALAVGVLVLVIYKWIQSVGGLKVAWAITVNAVLIAWDWLKQAFYVGIYWVLNLWDKMKYGIKSVAVSIGNFLGDLKANVLMILQNMVNGAIGLINDFIGVLNKIPGVSIATIAEVTFGTTSHLENEAIKQARNAELEAQKAEMEAAAATRDANIAAMRAEAQVNRSEREAEIEVLKAEAAAKKAAQDEELSIGEIAKIGEVGKIRDDVSISDEDIKMLKDVAAIEFINKYTTMTPNMTVTFGDVKETADVEGILETIEEMVNEAYASSLVGGGA